MQDVKLTPRKKKGDKNKHAFVSHSLERQEMLVICACGIIDIIKHSIFRRMLTENNIHSITFLVHHDKYRIRSKIIEAFLLRLKKSELPERYICVVPFIAVDPHYEKNRKDQFCYLFTFFIFLFYFFFDSWK